MKNQPARFIAAHCLAYAGVRGGVVDVELSHLLVCSGWCKLNSQRFGWRIERIDNTVQAARRWLGY